jgi:hypothetical protein
MPRGIIAPPKTIEEQAIIKAKLDAIGAPRLDKITGLNHNKHGERKGHPQKLFRRQPPEVANLARIYLAELMSKHKVKLESKSPKGRNGYYGILVGVATQMARQKLGLAKKSYAQMRRSGLPGKTMQRVYKKALGIIVPYHPEPINCEIREGDLTGV